MSITSLNFAGFVLLVLTVYYLIPRRPQNLWLLLASLVFYTTWSWVLVLVLATLAVANGFVGRRLPAGRSGRRAWLVGGIGLNLLALAAFKYAGFFVGEAGRLLAAAGLAPSTAILTILIPVGLSYRILENISLLVDTYRGQVSATLDPVELGLYSFFFPKLLSGPIERARSLLPQLAAPRVVDNDVLARGFTLITVGLVRKLVIADTLAAQVGPGVFVTPLDYGAPRLLFALVAYTFALYNDFAGYTDIVRGVSGLFGFRLMPNFAAPFFSRSLAEIWQRWHITLCAWLRDYIYLPLSRALLRRKANPRAAANLVLPPMAAMLISGLWHDLSLRMLAWGGLIGVYLVAGRLAGEGRPTAPRDYWPAWKQATRMILISGAICGAMIPFRMDLPVAWEFLRGLGHGWAVVLPALPLASMVALSLALDAAQSRGRDEAVFLRWPPFVQSLVLALAWLAVFLATRFESPKPFVYQGF
ncbi:MAG: MBOAT family O-acyltransferase [Acidobacteriota bacterium]